MPRRTNAAGSAKKRFAVGANVIVTIPGVIGVVTQLDDEPTSMWEYWHTIQTKFGERREPGSNLELVPRPETNSAPTKSTPHIHLHGDHSRINFNSMDNSTNITSVSHDRLFVQMHETARSVPDAIEREDIIARLNVLEQAHGTGGFLQAYQNFIASVANHVTVFAPFMSLLAQMLSSK